MEQTPQIYIAERAEWRKWLEDHHDKSPGIQVVFYKKEIGKPTLDYEEFVEEALCFGWIDGIIKKLDEERYLRKVMPRSDLFKWSSTNKNRVLKLIQEGKMTEAGLLKIGDYSKTGQLVWKENEKPVFPNELSEEYMNLLKENNQAFLNYENMAMSHKKRYILWVMSAKHDDTRLKRMQEAIKLLEMNYKNLNK